QTKEAFGALMTVLLGTRARAVRVWAMQLLPRWHQSALEDLPADSLLAMLDHSDSEIQQFGAQLFSSSKTLGTLPLETWLKLLQTENLTALELIVAAMERHVTPDRLTMQQLIELACARPVPVVRLAMRFLQTRTPQSDADRAAIANLAHAKCESEGGAIAKYALPLLGAEENYQADQLVRFFDSVLISMRQASWDWL